MLVLLTTLIFAFVFSLVYLLYVVGAERNQVVKERLRRFTTPGKEYSERERLLVQPFYQRLSKPLLAQVSRWVAWLTPQERQQKLRRQLAIAGNPYNWQVTDYLALKGLLTVGLLICGLCLARRVGLIMAISGYVAPDLWLRQVAVKRQSTIQKDLPDVLDLLTVSVEAGLGFDAALAKVIEKMEGPLIDELSRTLQEMRLGKPRRSAFRDLADRCQSEELATFVTALIQGDQLGVSISKILKIQAEQMRSQRRQRAEEAAMKAPVKMLFPLIIFIFPTIFILLLGPAAIRVLDTFNKM